MANQQLKINAREQIQLWNWINEYVVACGGDTSNQTVSNRRMKAVARIERTVSEIVHRNCLDYYNNDLQPREPNCQCHLEVGDSPCMVHGECEE